MATDDELFGSLYGVEPTEQPSEALYSDQPQQPAAVVVDEDSDLYQQLYGVAAPAEELGFDNDDAVAQRAPPGHADEAQPQPMDVQEPAALELPGTIAAPPGVWEAVAVEQLEQEKEGEDDDDDDDFVVTLDENATAVEPQANRFHYQRHQQYQQQPTAHHTAPGQPHAAEAIGAAPGQHVDGGGGEAAPGGMPQGPTGFGSRTAFGGIPRSAIPGMGGPALGMGLPDVGGGLGGPPHLGRPHQPPRGGMGGIRLEDAAFPSQAAPGQPIKLPGQTRVTPEEYREFLSLGHGDIFSLDIDRVVDPPWRYPGIDPSDFFNYGMNERTWKEYCGRVAQFRLEFTMQSQIQTLDSARAEWRRRMAERSGDPHHAREQQQLGDDEDYAAFVTAERPPRPQWPRWGGAEEHLISLAGGEVENPHPPATLMDYPHEDFFLFAEQQDRDAAQPQAQAQGKPPPHARPPPPPPARALPKPPPPTDGAAPGGAVPHAAGAGAAGGEAAVVKMEQPQQERPRSPPAQQLLQQAAHAEGPGPPQLQQQARPPAGPPMHGPPNGHLRPPIPLPPIGLGLQDMAMAAALPLPFMGDMGMPPDFGGSPPAGRFGRQEGDGPGPEGVKLEERMKVGGLAEGMDIDIPARGPPPRGPGGRFGPGGLPGPPFDRRMPPPFDFRGPPPPPPFRERGFRDFDRPPPPFARPDDRPGFRRDGPPGDFAPPPPPPRASREQELTERDRREAAGEPPSRRDAEGPDRERERERAARRQRSRSPVRERRRSRSRDRGRDRDRDRERGTRDRGSGRDGSGRDSSRERRSDRDRDRDANRSHKDSREDSNRKDSRSQRDRDKDRGSRR